MSSRSPSTPRQRIPLRNGARRRSRSPAKRWLLAQSPRGVPRHAAGPRDVTAEEPLGRSREQHWSNEQYVDDVSVSFLYQPHTLTALLVAVGVTVVTAFSVDSEGMETIDNIRLGVVMYSLVFLIMGTLVFPSGPFIRPHPVVWRVAFGVSVLYQLLLTVLLFQKRDDARKALRLFYDELGHEIQERDYADKCDFTYDNVHAAVNDIFFVSHFLGWVCKSVIIRDMRLCWIMSCAWELVEIGFTYMLPNFAECWWDQLILDVLLANGCGIYVGQKLLQYLEAKEYKWTDWDEIPSYLQKMKRVALQFTPERWTIVEMHALDSMKRLLQVEAVIIALTMQELSSFFLKHILWIPPSNRLNVHRLAVWFVIGIPTLRQLYIYICDPNCKRLGTQSWLAILILITEWCIILKFSPGIFISPMPHHIRIGWVLAGVVFVAMNVIFFLRIRRQNAEKVKDL